MKKSPFIPESNIESKIFFTRGKKVMLDKDLADLYEVQPKVLNQAVKRNIERFPEDFMFRLSKEEAYCLRSQIVTLKRGQHIKYLPYAFTEQGVAMLSSVLKSRRAIQVNIQIIRIFTRIKKIVINQKEVAQKLNILEMKTEKHDHEIKTIFAAIRELIHLPQPSKKKVGF